MDRQTVCDAIGYACERYDLIIATGLMYAMIQFQPTTQGHGCSFWLLVKLVHNIRPDTH